MTRSSNVHPGHHRPQGPSDLHPVATTTLALRSARGMMSRVENNSPPARDSRRRRFRIAVVAGSVVAAVAGSVLLATHDFSEKATTRGVTATLHLPGHPGAVIAGADALWVALGADPQEPAAGGRLVRLDLATGAQAQPVYLGGDVSHLTHVGDRLIASVQHGSGSGQLAALEWRSGTVLTRHWFERTVDAVVLRGRELWALEVRPGTLLRLDPETLDAASAPLRLSPGRTLGLASVGGYLWVTASDAGEVLRIDPETHAIKRVHVGGFPIGIVGGGGSVWVADHAGGKILRLDPRSLRPAGKPIRVGIKPSWLVTAGGSLFVTRQDDGTVARIDMITGKEVGLPIRVAPTTTRAPAPSVAPAGKSIWVSSFSANTLNRIDSTANRKDLGKLTVRITHTNDQQQGDQITDGSLAGTGDFVASGAVSEKGNVAVYRTVKGPLITLRFVTSGSKGTITFLVRIDTNFGTSRWTITSGTKTYKDLHGEGTERENPPTFTVQTLDGTVWR
jgi:streptogramin lyase